MTYHQIEKLPSRQIDTLKSLLNLSIVSIIRYDWESFEGCPRYIYEPPSYAFSLAGGPLSISLADGNVIAVGNDESMVSLILFGQKAAGGAVIHNHLLSDDNSWYGIKCCHETKSTDFWKSFLGSQFTDIFIGTRSWPTSERGNFAGNPNEGGLWFFASNGRSFIVSHKLFDNPFSSEDLTVVPPEWISPEVHAQVRWTSVRSSFMPTVG